MAYQNVERAPFRPPRNIGIVPDKATRAVIEDLADNLNRLNLEVVTCHNLIQQFAVSIGNGLTNLAVTMPAPMPDVNYFVGVQANFNNGGTWITAKTTTGFTLNWATATVGSQAARLLIVG